MIQRPCRLSGEFDISLERRPGALTNRALCLQFRVVKVRFGRGTGLSVWDPEQ